MSDHAEDAHALGPREMVNTVVSWFESQPTGHCLQDQPDSIRQISFQLQLRGSSAAPLICEHLSHRRPDVQDWALHQLQMMARIHGSSAIAPAAEKVAARLGFGNDDQEIGVAEALATLDPKSPQLMDCLIQLLRTAHPKCRFRAGHTIRDLAEEGISAPADAVDAAIACLQSNDWYSRLGGCLALEHVSMTDRALPFLLRCIRDEEEHVRLSAAVAFISCGGRDPAANAILQRELSEGDDTLSMLCCLRAIRILGADGGPFREKVLSMRARLVSSPKVESWERTSLEEAVSELMTPIR